MSAVDIEVALLQGRMAVVFGSGEASIMESAKIPKGTGTNARMPLSAGDRTNARGQFAALLNTPGGRDLIESLLWVAHNKGMDRATHEIHSTRGTGGPTMC